MVRRIRDKTLESRSARLDKPVRKTPVLVSTDEACRSVVGGTRLARGCFAKPTDRDYTDPGHSDPTVDYSVECNRSKRVSITGPRCKPTVDLQGRTVPLYLNHDRPGENNPQ